jgi:hypothetical protein
MTKVRTAAPGALISQSSAVPGDTLARADLSRMFLPSSTAAPRKARPAAARERISGEFSPTPPVKTRTSRPPSAAAMAAIDARSRCT